MIQIINANTADGIPLADNSVDCVVTSPPYWGLRDYGTAAQLGLERTPQEYVENMRKVFEDVRRVLKPTGTLWLNLGDSFAASAKGSGGTGNGSCGVDQATNKGSFYKACFDLASIGLKPKDLCGIPWRVAFALQADGWYLRNDIIWHKPNPMPESVTDRCTRAHEYVFHLTKSAKYYYDAAAIAEANTWPDHNRFGNKNAAARGVKELTGNMRPDAPQETDRTGRNRRTVWTIATQPTPDAHFATYPEKLVEPCILAGCPVGGVVLDPFCGSGTTLRVAERLGRSAIGLEINPQYIEIAKRKTAQAYLKLAEIA